MNKQLPEVGTKLKFTHDIDSSKFKYLYDERYGWEYGDDLEVIHHTVDHRGGDVVIVMNAENDVLTTAVISDLDFFDTRTEDEKYVDQILSDIQVDNVGLFTVKGLLLRLKLHGYYVGKYVEKTNEQ
jgi:hypothetical protein